MRIIYLHQYFHTPDMHGSTRSYEMARRLVAYGHDVQMVTSDPGLSRSRFGRWTKSIEAGINVHWLGLPYSNTMSYSQRVKAFIQFALSSGRKALSLGGDIVFATSTPLTIALPAVFAAIGNRIPMVFEVRDLWPEIPIALSALKDPFTKALACWLEKFAYRNSKEVVALSPGMKEGIVRTGYPEHRISVIPNSCDFELFDIKPEEGQKLRKKHDWLGTRPMVIYTGTMGLVNGVDYLVQVARYVREINSDVRFVVVGADSREKEKVAQCAEKMGLLNKNFYMMPPAPKREIPAWLSAADITTSTVIDVKELWANSANKFFDSLAAARPIAINHRGWQADLIEHYDCGLVLDPNDTRASAIKLDRALRDRQWLAKASVNARCLGKKKFDRDQLSEKFEQILARCVMK